MINWLIDWLIDEVHSFDMNPQRQLCFILTSLCINDRVEARLILNFKVTRQGHKIHPNIFEFHDLNYVTIDNNLINLSHLHHEISWFTNNGKNIAFWPPSRTFDVMACHVTASRWCNMYQNVSFIHDNRHDEANFVIGIIKIFTEEKHQGFGPQPLLTVRWLSTVYYKFESHMTN